MTVLRFPLRDVFQPVLRPGAGGYVPQEGGPELVTNGNFATDTAWTKGAQWTIASGVATKTGVGDSILQQSLAITVGASYVVTFTITSTVTAGDGMSFFLGQTSSAIRSAPGTYTETLVPVLGTNLEFGARGADAWEGSIDNVSVKASFF